MLEMEEYMLCEQTFKIPKHNPRRLVKMQVPRPHPTQTYRIRISAGRSRNLHFNKLPHIILTQIRSLWYLAFKTLPYLVPASLSSQPSCLLGLISATRMRTNSSKPHLIYLWVFWHQHNVWKRKNCFQLRLNMALPTFISFSSPPPA